MCILVSHMQTFMDTAAAVPAPCPVTVQAIMFLMAQWEVLSPATHLGGGRVAGDGRQRGRGRRKRVG